MKTKYKFIEFVQPEDRNFWCCYNRKKGDDLGSVEWCGPWKKWIFCPDEDAVFSADCLADIQHFMGQLKHP